jgi:hypothetical protein
MFTKMLPKISEICRKNEKINVNFVEIWNKMLVLSTFAKVFTFVLILVIIHQVIKFFSSLV